MWGKSIQQSISSDKQNQAFLVPKSATPEKAGDRRNWGNACGSGFSLAICHAALAHEGLTLVIAPDTQTGLQIEQDVSFFSSGKLEILSFPDWETLPYDSFSPHQDIVSQRISTLYKLPQISRGVLVVPLTTLVHRTSPRSFMAGYSLVLDQGDTFDPEKVRGLLEQSGYRCTNTVYEHGEFAVRGSIVDIFPMGSDTPYRIELFDDEIDSLRTFDPETQRSKDKMDRVRLLPAKEFPLEDNAIARFKLAWKEAFDVNHRACPVYQDISNGITSGGIEYYLPLFFEQTETLFNFLPADTLVITTEGFEQKAQQFWKECEERYENLRHDNQRPILPPGRLFVPVNELHQLLKQFGRIVLKNGSVTDRAGDHSLNLLPPPDLTINAKSSTPLSKLESYLIEATERQQRVVFCAESAGRKETLLELLARIEIHPVYFQNWGSFLKSDEPIGLVVAPLAEGLLSAEPAISLIAETQLFGHRVMQRRRRKKTDTQLENPINNLTELSLGNPVVHIDHGVGRYQGLQSLDIDGQPQEFLTLEYANAARLYVPVSSLHLISRYSGASDELAPLHKLGTEQWSREKRKAAEQIRDTAAELLNIYARRAAKKGHAFSVDHIDYEKFSAGFPFEETPDQQAAIDAVISDMKSTQPTDRLVCGDVGFGKTEVAMRATFVAVQDGRQVAVLVPTTLLAQQHYETFKDRFAGWAVNIEVLSRFRTSKEQTETLEKLKNGKTDIIIGTHKLLQDSIKFSNLGLLIVDEEHRFGVKHKEKLKTLRANIDMLTLTATPIPRTLNMAMSGIRDLSIIATPPAKRLSIKTFVHQHNNSLVKEAILREILRGGQVYYLHNEVKNIEKRARDLAELVPEARVCIAHGQMRERELEQIMSNFYHKQFNLLVCTTIIETGIDIPTANTIIMDRADSLGLAQLHQLRGRVGRSHHQAYAYLMTPPPKAITTDAKKRLEAICEAHDLGAGFTLASHDLEIRGAGELLGEEQSGNMHSIGFSLYMEMLEKAVAAIKEGKTPNLDKPLEHGTEINLRLPALISDAYLPDVHTRLIMYKRIANARSDHQLDELRVEMIDRFGMLPEPTQNLFTVTALKLKAQPLGINKIDGGPRGGRLEFSSDTNVDPLSLVKLIQSQPQFYKLEGSDRLRFTIESESYGERLELIDQLIDKLTPTTTCQKT